MGRLSTSVGVSRPFAHVLTAVAHPNTSRWSTISHFFQWRPDYRRGRYTTALRPSTKTSQTSRIVVHLSLGMGRERSRFTVSHIRYSHCPAPGARPLPGASSSLLSLTLARCADPDEGCQAAEACSDRIPMTVPDELSMSYFSRTLSRYEVFPRGRRRFPLPVLISHETQMSHATGRLAPSQRCSSWHSGSTGRTMVGLATERLRGEWGSALWGTDSSRVALPSPNPHAARARRGPSLGTLGGRKHAPYCSARGMAEREIDGAREDA